MAADCEQCGTKVSAFTGTMVMIHNSLWSSICKYPKEVICDRCIEIRLGSKLTIQDLKPARNGDLIPVNKLWIETRLGMMPVR